MIVSCTINECPVSLISADSIQLVGDYFGAKSTHHSFGAVPYGHDSNAWPVFWVDAVEVLQRAEAEANAIEMGHE